MILDVSCPISDGLLTFPDHSGLFWSHGYLVSHDQILLLLLAAAAAAAAKLLQSCPTLGNPRDGSPPDSTVPGILRARTLECVAISFSNA